MVLPTLNKLYILQHTSLTLFRKDLFGAAHDGARGKGAQEESYLTYRSSKKHINHLKYPDLDFW